jgi:ABC-2 type transport system permease protein
MMTALVGTGPLLRASLRHDARKFVPFIVLATALSASSVLVYPWIFPSEESRAGLAMAISANPALGLIFGPAYDISTADGFNAWRSLALGGFLAALGAIILFGGDPEASILLGLTFTATGWMFAAVAAVTAQLGSDSRTASSMAIGVLGVLFVARGFLYSIEAPEWTTWLDPLGWMTETRPATGDVWWPLALAVVLTVIVLAIAFALQARRDFGQGAVTQRPGPARGRDRSTLRLALRLNRGSLITWSVAFVALGVVFGYFATSIRDVLGSDSAIRQVLAAGATTPDALLAAFLTTMLSLVGIIASISGVQAMVKVRTEEMEDRVEPIIATAASRPRYYASNVVVALGTSTVCVLVAGALIALLASTADLGISFDEALLQAVVTVPAVWTVVAVAVAVIGARPQVMLAAWAGVLLSFVLTVLGPSFNLWDWILAISPFWHIPKVTAADADWIGLILITTATVVLLAVGFAGFRRRDLAR